MSIFKSVLHLNCRSSNSRTPGLVQYVGVRVLPTNKLNKMIRLHIIVLCNLNLPITSNLWKVLLQYFLVPVILLWLELSQGMVLRLGNVTLQRFRMESFMLNSSKVFAVRTYTSFSPLLPRVKILLNYC